ncbi:MAG: acyl-CoA dehydrogenase family protein, partial [Bacteriovoracaceae bacterium]
MNYLEEEHLEIYDMAKKFAEAEVAPLAAEIDSKGEIPQSLRQKLSESGFMGIFVPEEYGGAGMDYLSYSLVVDQISKACASTGVLVSAHLSLATWPILNYGNEDQKKKYLPKLASGEWVGCFCLSEPDAGSDAASLSTFAEDKGDHYILNGTKNWITNGKEAKLAIVFAKTEKTDNHKGMSAFIVETDWEGFNVSKLEDKLGIKGSSTTQISIENLKVPKENLLGKEKKGFSIGLGTLDGGRIGIASQAVGIADGAFSYAKKYSTERIQFGAPISNLQA